MPAVVFTNVFVVFILAFVNAAIFFIIPTAAFHGIVCCDAPFMVPIGPHLPELRS
jgi:hypothetical protein